MGLKYSFEKTTANFWILNVPFLWVTRILEWFLGAVDIDALRALYVR